LHGGRAAPSVDSKVRSSPRFAAPNDMGGFRRTPVWVPRSAQHLIPRQRADPTGPASTKFGKAAPQGAVLTAPPVPRLGALPEVMVTESESWWRAALVLTLGWLPALAGCATSRPPSTSPRLCTEVVVWGLIVRVEADGLTAPEMCQATEVTATDGRYEERLRGDYSTEASGVTYCRFIGADERAGTFDLRIAMKGRGERRISGVKVGHDGCHPVTRTVEVRFPEPKPSRHEGR
jgi:hypothetical protein